MFGIFEYDTGVIDVFINAIRKIKFKIEELYKTVRGIGYIAND
jgi:DNA-binding response OmpR family regulator